jgi:hypothetical protein
MLLLLIPQGPAVTPVDAGEVIDQLLPYLGAYQAANLNFWTEDELFAFADEGLKRFASRIGGFVEHNDDEALVDGTAAYSLPTRHLSTIYVAAGDVTIYPTTRQGLDALDSDWTNTADDAPTNFFQDNETQIRVYPKPNSSTTGDIGIIHHQYPAAVDDSSPSVTAPAPFAEYLMWYTLSEARGKESDGAMPEVSKFFAGMVDLFESIAREYWGQAQ